MNAATASAGIYLAPGEFHFGGNGARIHTLLGSCVAITLWHPVLRCGGMCHFLLPGRNDATREALDGRYGDEAVRLFLRETDRLNTTPGEYQAKLFGGGNMFYDLMGGGAVTVGQRNIEAARVLLRVAGFALQEEDVGGSGYRKIIFDLGDGSVWVRHEKKADAA